MKKNILYLFVACIFTSFMMSCSDEMYTLPESENLGSGETILLTTTAENLQPVTKISDIQNWTGTGSNSSVLAIQWVTAKDIEHPTNDEIHFLAWGYRWNNPAPKGIDMVEAIVQKDPRLFVVLAEQWGGTVIKGFAYDGNNDGKICISSATGTVLTQDDFINGIYDAESTESFDGLTTTDPNDLWIGGWMDAYATYWLGTNGTNVPTSFEYSSVLVSGRSLENNSWDAWTFSSINSGHVNVDPKPALMKAAPNN